MLLVKVEARDVTHSYLAVVEVGDPQPMRLEVNVRNEGLELTDDLDRFVGRFPMKARALCGVILEVVDGTKKPPIEF